MAISDYASPEEAARAGDPEALAQINAFVTSVTPIDQLVRHFVAQNSQYLEPRKLQKQVS